MPFLHLVPEILDLNNELQKVIDWMVFGLNLGFEVEELQTIQVNYANDLKKCRFEMLIEWQKKVTPTWSAVIQALMDTGMRHLASELAQKHGWLKISCMLFIKQRLTVSMFLSHSGVPPPKLPDDEALRKLTNISQQEKVTL